MKVYITTSSYWHPDVCDNGWRSEISGVFKHEEDAIESIKKSADGEIAFAKVMNEKVSRFEYDSKCLIFVPVNDFESPKYSIKTENGKGVVWRAVFEKEAV